MSESIPTPEIRKEMEEELFLLIKRDFPNMKEKVDSINTMVVAMKEDITSIKTLSPTSMPWYLDFQKILIFLLVVGFMILAGVKSYDNIVQHIIPSGDAIVSQPKM